MKGITPRPPSPGARPAGSDPLELDGPPLGSESLQVAAAGLQALLEAVGWEVAIARADGHVLFASRNADATLLPALTELSRTSEAPVESLADRLVGAQVRWLPANDGVRYALVWYRADASEGLSPLERAEKMWGLTPRQREVLCLLAEGKSNRAIAKMLACSERTVELHVASLFRKSDSDSRTALVAKFWRSVR